MKRNIVFGLFLIVVHTLQAQQNNTTNAAAIYQKIEKLNFLGKVLYVAAHPDDENTKLIAYCANQLHAQTAYLSLTRGDGGQNLIGPELREKLGVIRTQELLEARKIDGGKQFFTNANDFGFSKNPTETLQKWDANKILHDMVWVIRKYKPDVIINRFDHRTPGTTHGHHTTSAMLSLQAFEMAASDKEFLPQLNKTQTWQTSKLYFNNSWFFYQNKEKFDAADKSKFMAIDIGDYNPLNGYTNQDIAAWSRSKHQSQGFGTSPTRGEEKEYLELIYSKTSQNNTLFDGINTTWSRVKNGEKIGKAIDDILKKYDFKAPEKSVHDLLSVYLEIEQLEDSYWKNIKQRQVVEVIKDCLGLFVASSTSKSVFLPNENLNFTWEIVNRSTLPVNLLKIIALHNNAVVKETPLELKNNIRITEKNTIVIPANQPYTTPYWLENEYTDAHYVANNQEDWGLAERKPPFELAFLFEIEKIPFTVVVPIMHHYNDEVKGAQKKPIKVLPKLSLSFKEKIIVSAPKASKKVAVRITTHDEAVNGILNIVQHQEKKDINLAHFPIQLGKNKDTLVQFSLQSDKAVQSTISAELKEANQNFSHEIVAIDYEHIAPQHLLVAARAKWIVHDIKITSKKIGYIGGAGDQLPEALQQLGCQVVTIPASAITPEVLAPLDAIVVGIRAYNTVDDLQYKNNYLLDFVAKGGNMLVQYNTNSPLVLKDFAPYPLQLSRNRITNEKAKVTITQQQHTVLNKPNTIDATLFNNWVQEQGLYYPSSWDSKYQTIFSASDDGETPLESGVLIAPYGKGNYIYTSLSLFRQLPEGVLGAYQLLANCLSLPTH